MFHPVSGGWSNSLRSIVFCTLYVLSIVSPLCVREEHFLRRTETGADGPELHVSANNSLRQVVKQHFRGRFADNSEFEQCPLFVF